MWWIIIPVWLILGIITQIIIRGEQSVPEQTPEKERAERRSRAWFWMLMVVAAVPLLYALYWFWYYACCGFLVVDMAETVIEWIAYFIISMAALAFYGGFIAILFGWWNPRL